MKSKCPTNPSSGNVLQIVSVIVNENVCAIESGSEIGIESEIETETETEIGSGSGNETEIGREIEIGIQEECVDASAFWVVELFMFWFAFCWDRSPVRRLFHY